MARELRKLGVEHGDTLFVHSSFKSLGPVDGGVETVIHALEDAVGSEGLILMPSFDLEGGRELRAKNWSISTTRSTVGWITEYFRTMPGTYRSDHYSHSVAARGKGARDFAAGNPGGGKSRGEIGQIGARVHGTMSTCRGVFGSI